MEIIPIFANPIFSLDIPIPEGLPQYCLGMEKGQSRSNIGGWQTNKTIHHNSKLFHSYLNQNFPTLINEQVNVFPKNEKLSFYRYQKKTTYIFNLY